MQNGSAHITWTVPVISSDEPIISALLYKKHFIASGVRRRGAGRKRYMMKKERKAS